MPDLRELAQLRAVSQFKLSGKIFYASCLEILRLRGSLDGVSLRLLTALRTNIHKSYTAVSQSERDVLKNEIDRLIFLIHELQRVFLGSTLSRNWRIRKVFVLTLECCVAKMSLKVYVQLYQLNG